MKKEEAINLVKQVLPCLNIDEKIREGFETLIPELRESEDERVRKDILGGLMWQRDNLKREGPHDDNLILPGFCLTVGEQLAYLEKQKERKPINNSTREKIISRATSEKQVVLISESNGNAEIGWDTRSLEDAKKLLEYGLAFINKEEQKFAPISCSHENGTEWSDEDESHRNFILESLEDQIRFCKKDVEGAYCAKQIRTAQNWLKSLRPNK